MEDGRWRMEDGGLVRACALMGLGGRFVRREEVKFHADMS